MDILFEVAMIYYLGYYSCEQIASEQRKAPPPAMNKMGYIISVLSKICSSKTIVVSPSETRMKQYVKGSLCELADHISLKTFDSFGSQNKILRGLGHWLTKLQLIVFLLTHIKKDDTLIVYHSLALMKSVKLAKRIKRCNLIVEVEEVYADVKENERVRKKELQYFNIADKYIVITDLLNKQINQQNKPSILSHGTYRTNPHYSEKFSDGRIHVVYAGTFNPLKGGVCSAIDAAEYLDDQYVLHILGKGSGADTAAVKARIEEISQKSKCTIIFEGYKTGREFDSFIQSCHIGLSTQQPNGKYNASSFPSKVLMYMSNGLPVVSIRIPAVETSAIGDYVFYYDTPTPQDIAQVVKSVPIGIDLGIREKLHELDETFKKDLSNLLKRNKKNQI